MRLQLLASSHTFELFHKSSQEQQVPNFTSKSRASVRPWLICVTIVTPAVCRIRLLALSSLFLSSTPKGHLVAQSFPVNLPFSSIMRSYFWDVECADHFRALVFLTSPSWY